MTDWRLLEYQRMFLARWEFGQPVPVPSWACDHLERTPISTEHQRKPNVNQLRHQTMRRGRALHIFGLTDGWRGPR